MLGDGACGLISRSVRSKLGLLHRTFEGVDSGKDGALGDWGLFYWRLRYRLRAVKKVAADGSVQWEAVLRERFRFINRANALDL